MLRNDSACLTASTTGVPVNTRLHVIRVDADCATIRMVDGAQAYLPAQNLCPAPSGVDWSQARNYVGQVRTVCGGVVGASYGPDVKGQPLWVHVGGDKPSANRFQVVIRGLYEGHPAEPPENDYLGRWLCVTGLITLDGSVPQMDVTDPWAIFVQ